MSYSPYGFKEFFFFYYESMEANDLRYGQFGPKGEVLHRGPLNIIQLLTNEALDMM